MERKCSVLWKWFDLLNWTPISCTLSLNNQNSIHDYHLSVPTGIVEDQLVNTQPTLELTFILYKMTHYYFNQMKAILIFLPTISAPYKLSASAPTRLLYGFEFTITTGICQLLVKPTIGMGTMAAYRPVATNCAHTLRPERLLEFNCIQLNK